MPAPSDWAGVGTALCWGDRSALHGGLTPLSFPLQGSRGAKGAKVSLCFCTIFLCLTSGRHWEFGNHFMIVVLCFRVRKAGVELMASMA